MLSTTAKNQCRVHIGERCLDSALSGSRNISLLVALLAALALLIAFLPLASVVAGTEHNGQARPNHGAA